MNLVVNAIYLALTAYAWLIVIRALLSWVHPYPGSWLGRVDLALARVTEPYVGLFRRILPPLRTGGVGIDLSPMLALLVLVVVMEIIVRL